MFSSMNAFKTFSTRLNFDGPCFRRCYQIFKSVFILHLTLTICQGVEVKTCIGNAMFDNSTNKCIECSRGYFGRGCIHACPPTTYGLFCASTCNCSASQCNPNMGCNIICQGVEVKNCIGNTMFDNSINKCIDCPDGLFGTGCIHPCPPTKYGRFCANSCNCSAVQCNAITGCIMGATSNDRVKEQNITLSTEFTYKIHSTFTISPNTSSGPMTRKTVENKHRTLVLIAVAGTFISTLLLIAIGFELRSRIIFRRREPNYSQENMFCENGNVYAEVNNIK